MKLKHFLPVLIIAAAAVAIVLALAATGPAASSVTPAARANFPSAR